MPIRYGLFALLIMSASITKADNNTFIDEHFAQDSVLVLVKGAFLSSVIEALCLEAPVLRGGQPVGFCQGFAPEFVTFAHLAKSQWTTDAVNICSNLYMFFFGGTFFYDSDSWIVSTRHAVNSMVYYQAARSLASTVASYRAEIKQQDKKLHIEVSGILGGLMAGGLSLVFAYRYTLQHQTLTLLASSLVVAMATSFFYVAFGDAETKSDFKKNLTVVIAVAGVGIIIMTGLMSRALLQSSDATVIRRSLTVIAAAGLPLMVSSWLVSLERFVEDSVAMHETMQNEFMFSLSVSKVLSLANWVNWPIARVSALFQ